MTKIAFRVDASTTIGSGHLMRCLTLADALRAKGATVSFICGPLPGAMRTLIQRSEHDLFAVGDCEAGTQEDMVQTRAILERVAREKTRYVGWLVIDHYKISKAWEANVRPRVGKILVIDDLADRPHDCDVILDQNFHENMNSRYDQLVPERCIKALGPAFALLRQEFYRARQTLRPRDGALKRILVAFGGSDPSNETAKVLEALGRPGLRELQVDVVIGGANRHKCELFARYEGDARIRFYENTGNVAELMSAADLSVGAGGTMNWERSYLGLPTIVIVIAENQAETSGALHRAGAIVNLGWHANVSSNQIAQAVEKLSGSPSALKDLSRRSMAVMAPDGVAAAEIKILKTIVVS